MISSGSLAPLAGVPAGVSSVAAIVFLGFV
jgi:hypothetical protein